MRPRLTNEDRHLMWRCIVIVCVTAMACSIALGGELDTLAVVRITGNSTACSATIVTPTGLIVSAEHCDCGSMTAAHFRDGRTVAVEQVYEPAVKQGRDEVAVLRIVTEAPDDGWPFIPVADYPPPIGARVFAYGYPAAHGWVEADPGRLIAETERLQWLEGIEKGGPGMSGGALIHGAGLVGVCSGSGGSDAVEGVTVIGGNDRGDGNYDLGAKRYISWSEIRKSLDAATSEQWSRSRRVVIFTATSCIPCERLKRDIAAGHFSRFDLVQHVYNSQSGTWATQDGADAYKAFWNKTKPGEPHFPIIWVEGTSEFREGYKPEERGGLVGFLDRVLRAIGGILVGHEKPVRAPMAGGDPAPAPIVGEAPPPPVEPAPATPPGYDNLKASVEEVVADIKALKDGSLLEKLSAIRSIREDVSKAREAASDAKLEAVKAGDDVAILGGLGDRLTAIKGDVDAIKSGNPIEKLKAVASLKSEVGELREDAAGLREDVKGDPMQLLYTLVFGITGLLHRRHAA